MKNRQFQKPRVAPVTGAWTLAAVVVRGGKQFGPTQAWEAVTLLRDRTGLPDVLSRKKGKRVEDGRSVFSKTLVRIAGGNAPRSRGNFQGSFSFGNHN